MTEQYSVITGNYWTRDTEGHGTHMLSTVVGSFVPRTSLFGYATVTAKTSTTWAHVST
jgi:hypothetical protein